VPGRVCPLRYTPGFLRLQAVGYEPRGCYRQVLGGVQPFGGDTSLRHGPLFDEEHWLARIAIQKEGVAHLAGLAQGRDAFFAALELDPRRGGRQIVIP
jgi:hypothetical protein